MAPTFSITGRAAGFDPADLDDEMAMLEDTFQKSTEPHDEEVEVFAKYLDDCVLDSGSTSQKLDRVFKLVESYSSYVNDRAQALRARIRLAAAARAGSAARQVAYSDDASGQENEMDIDEGPGRPGPPASPAELERWEHEAQTWDLLRRVLPLTYGDPERAGPVQPHGPLWLEFMRTVPGALESKAVLEWLQLSAGNTRPDIDEMVQDLQQNADRGDILAHGWLHTRTAIKMYKTHMHMNGPVEPRTADATGSNLRTPHGPMVTQLDPDVATRQGRKLAPQDEYFERAIWLGCFELLRRGCSLAEIRDWCQERTEAWRAVSVSGLPLSLDPPRHNSPGSDADVSQSLLPIILWKRMCGKLAREGGADDFERATYGILSGDRERVEAVCRSWDDFVFAHYNSQLRAMYDQFLVHKCGPAATTTVAQFGSVDFDGAAQSIKALITKLEKRPSTATDAKKPAKTLQTAVLCNTLDEFLDKQGGQVADEVAADLGKPPPTRNAAANSLRFPGAGSPSLPSDKDPHWTRTISHVFIVVATLNEITKAKRSKDRLQNQENVVASYVAYLRRAGLDDLVPLYCSKLSDHIRYECLSRNLIHVAERDAQIRLLSLAQRMGLHPEEFVKTQPPLYLTDANLLVHDSTSRCPARQSFHILADGPPTYQYGRLIKPGVLGNDPEDPEAEELEKEDERIIRSLEWMLLVSGLVKETFDFGVQAYKYFLKYKRLVAARAFAERVSCADILRDKLGMAIPEDEETWWDEVFSPARLESLEGVDDDIPNLGMTREQLAEAARPLFELECAVRVMDCLETTAQITGKLSTQTRDDREVAKSLSGNAKLLKEFMKPLLKDWLLTSPKYEKEFALIREAYLPELVIGYASALHVAGTTATRDYLLECMELAASIAEEGSDVAEILVRTGRMKEMLESFASCSKALAICTTESNSRKSQGPNSKKYRETGRSLELWTVRN